GPALATRLAVPYYLHPYDAIHPVDLLPARIAYHPLDEALDLRIGRVRLEPLWIPGHTLGSVAVLVDGRYLLAGDSIFLRSIARPDLGGHADAWTPLHYRSLRRLLTLPDTTVVLPGHFSGRDEADRSGVFAATLGQLRHANDGLVRASGDSQAFAEYITSTLPHFPKEYLDIKRINAGLLQADEERCAELETGKNQCAMESRT
ncbi:MAG: MBL fold metallo-hydrolase, partial [Myxococcaceae bacterium]